MSTSDFDRLESDDRMILNKLRDRAKISGQPEWKVIDGWFYKISYINHTPMFTVSKGSVILSDEYRKMNLDDGRPLSQENESYHPSQERMDNTL